MHVRMHTHAHARTHACICMLNMLNMLNMDASMSAVICNFYTCINVRVCMCVHVCVYVCGDTPMPPDAPPRASGSPKHQKFNKSLTNRDNSILFEDSLPLNIPEFI